MGFARFAEGVTAPVWPHVRCVRSTDVTLGWAWPEDPARRACYEADGMAAPPDLVADAIDGAALPGVDRVLAIARLHQLTPGGMLRLFQKTCRACGRNHLERAQRAVRAAKVIHPAAVALLREAQVPESLLCEPRYLKPRSLRSPAPGKGSRGLPIWKGDPARTWMAQTMFARQYALQAGIPIGASSAPSVSAATDQGDARSPKIATSERG